MPNSMNSFQRSSKEKAVPGQEEPYRNLKRHHAKSNLFWARLQVDNMYNTHFLKKITVGEGAMGI